MKMTKYVILANLIVSSSALADGFVCTSDTLNIKVYNHTQAEDGTRNAAVMVLSDPAINQGRKTIAKFTADHAVLSQNGATYVANVDLRFNDSERKGEIVGPTKLGQLDQIVLDVDFSYDEPVLAGTQLPAVATLIKRNGQEIDLDMVCTRYLKN